MAAAENLATGGIFGGLTPQLSHPDRPIPFHLRKKTLKTIRRVEGRVPESLWNERGEYIEKDVGEILKTQTQLVADAIMHPPYTEGSDLTVKFVDGFVLDEVKVEVKSSGIGVRAFKQEVRDSLPPQQRNEAGIRNWLVEHNVILINGNEEKSDEEILNDSFYPQLERISRRRLLEGLRRQSPQLENPLAEPPTQIFPAIK